MKNWEAMLAGAKIRPQSFTQMYDGKGSCAVGAMFEGHGNELSFLSCSDAWGLVRELDMQYPHTECPLCNTTFGLGTTTWHLNDIHQWSRENIAHFLRSVEDPTSLVITPAKEISIS